MVTVSVAGERICRPPGPLAKRGILRCGGESPRIGKRVDHRRDDRFRSEIQRAAGHVEAAHRHTHDGRFCGGQNRGETAQNAVFIVAAMLHVERDGIEALCRHDLDGQRIGDTGPAREHHLIGFKTLFERHDLLAIRFRKRQETSDFKEKTARHDRAASFLGNGSGLGEAGNLARHFRLSCS